MSLWPLAAVLLLEVLLPSRPCIAREPGHVDGWFSSELVAACLRPGGAGGLQL